jgi:uroporphyrinogen decarboxylase
MTKRERIQAVIRRVPTDRPPYALWRHFPAVDRSPAGLAQSILRFHERYGPDLLKITPARAHAVEDWGGEEADAPGSDGARPIARYAIQAGEDWKRIRPVELGSNGWGSQLEVAIRVVIDRRVDCPVMVTLSSALSLAHALAGNRLVHDLRAHPQAVADALEAIAEMNLRLAEACGREGTEGIFYVVDPATGLLPDPDSYWRFGEPYDRRVLEAARRRGAITVLHAEGMPESLDRLATLPADVWSGDDRRGGPSIRERLTRVPGALIGGLDAETLRHGTAAEVTAEAQDAIAQAGGVGLVVGPGSGLLADTPDAKIVELVRSLGGRVKLGLIKPEH